MAPRSHRSIQIILLLFILLLTSVPTDIVKARNIHHASSLPPLKAFTDELRNGQADELRGIYIPEVLAASIVQQPSGRNGYVSNQKNTVTQFGLASDFKSTGLLAHNYLAGEGFASLEKGQEIYLIYGDGKILVVSITEILQYQALQPNSVTSDFLNLDGGHVLTAPELFTKVYNRPGQVILQTCIAREGNPSWGRLFVIAKPYKSEMPH
ncbi:MAG TPA: hypothetical protein VK851_00720 [Anaerolineales bacterium]|nr:hypothetical protein [Anaerolineales bacterium]